MHKLELYRLESPFREDMVVRGYQFGKGEKAACIVGPMRGNEIQQLYICSQLIQRLKELEANGCISTGKQILVIPSGNVYSMNVGRRFWGMEGTDINRMFPGNVHLDTAERIADAANVKENARQEGMQQGYQDGIARADQETNQRMAQLEQKEKDLESAYETKIQELEPQFIDTLTGIYEHIFQVELQGYRDILSYLITNTMRKIEGNRSFFIHVSKEDYPFVSMQKKQFTASVASGSSVEVVEDLTLSKNQCLIETEDGIFDCGVSTQLTELSNRLKLLSYEKE